jgi:acyl carrier protein
MAMLSRDEILHKLTGYFEELFEVPPDRVTLDSRLYEDLDLDSIDAVDLVVKLQHFTNRKFTPDEFRSVRTVRDVVDRVHGLLDA